jgi:hypothetical protein
MVLLEDDAQIRKRDESLIDIALQLAPLFPVYDQVPTGCAQWYQT